MYTVGRTLCTSLGMKTVIDLDEDLLDRARRERGTATEKDTIHEALRLVAERGARLDAIHELMAIDRDWTGIVDDDKAPASGRDSARRYLPACTSSIPPRGHA
jgi:Arc/MetJ family transcription regulator